MSYRFLHGRKNKKCPSKPFGPFLNLEMLEDRLTPAAPAVSSLLPTSLTPLSAVLGGTVDTDGGLLVIKRGVVFSLTSQNANPTIGGAGVMQVDAPPYANVGAFYVTVGNLAANNNYTFKAFAVNPDGTGYAPAANFTAPIGIVMPNSTVTP